MQLSVVITIVSGRSAICDCLRALCRQVDFETCEIIVPFDKFSADVGSLAGEFPEVNFHFIHDLGAAASADISAHAHRLYDRRRAIGLGLSRGRLIAMAEDHGIPSPDWVKQILLVHESSAAAVIGGAVQNGVDKPLNRALYYCDFGRYGLPLNAGQAEYVSDINLAYKRDALFAIKDIWSEAYHETTVHWELRSLGNEIRIDDRPVVTQRRTGLRLLPSLRERIEWGRVFAETRGKEFNIARRLGYAAGTIILPPLMLRRVYGHMKRQKLPFGKIAATVPVLSLVLTAWAVGECLGYLVGEPSLGQGGSADLVSGKKVTAVMKAGE